MGSNDSNRREDSAKGEKKLYYHGLIEQKRIDISKLKVLSLILAVVGLAVILIAAQSAQAPLAKVGDVYGNYLMNYAVVRVEGNVSEVPSVSESGGKLSVIFSVSDGTGSLDIRVYSPVAERMIRAGAVPMPGDRVEAEVQLRVRETYTYGILNYLGGLKFMRKVYSPNPERVNSLDKSLSHRYVTVEGMVEDSREVSRGLLFDVDTGAGKVTVLLPKVLYVLSGRPNVTAGDSVSVAGVVYLYKGTSPELVVRNLSDVRVKRLEAKEIPLGEVASHEGEVIETSGRLGKISYDPDTKEYLITLTDGSNVTAVASREVLSEINPLKAGTGSEVKAVGKVVGGKVKATKFEVIKPVPPRISKVSKLSSAELGKIVVVEGNVVDVTSIGSNLKLALSDGSGKIAVFIPSPVVSELGGEVSKIKPGLGLRVAGYLTEYRGSLEIVPYTGAGIVAYGEPVGGGSGGSTTHTPAYTKLSELSSTSGTVKLRVKWLGVYYSKPNYLIEVSDESGTANLSVKRSLIPNPLKAGTGSELEVTYDADAKEVIGVKVVAGVASPKLQTGEVSASYLGKTVVVEGAVRGVYQGSTFVKLTIDDGSGELIVFIPKSVAGDKTFSEGQTVKVGGYVTEYRGSVEVVPYRGDAVILEG